MILMVFIYIYIYFFFSQKFSKSSSPGWSIGFGFPEELRPRWDDKASIQVDARDGTGAPGGPRKVLFYKEKVI